MKKIIGLIFMLVMVLSLACAFSENESSQDQNNNDAKYVLERNAFYRVDQLNDNDENWDNIPSFFPMKHGARIYNGEYLEMPVNTYIYVDPGDNVKWMCDYYRLEDIHFKKGYKMSLEKISHRESFSYYPYKILVLKEGVMKYSICIYKDITDEDGVSKKLVVRKLFIESASKKQGTIYATDVETGERFLFTKQR